MRRLDDGRRDFDFFFGAWRVANRKRVDLLRIEDDDWIEFDGEVEAWPILGGLGNIDTFRAPEFPGRPGFEGFTLRLFEPETGLWRIWWASTIGQGQLDPPVVGRFRNGLGRFECDDVIEGQRVRVRFDWTNTTPTSVTWEQAFSFDEGATWDINWIMQSTRTSERRKRLSA
jgi:hypothetical protein